MKFITIDRQKLRREAERMNLLLRREVEEEKALVERNTREAAIYAANEAARITFPNRIGFVKARNKMEADVYRVYTTPGAIHKRMISAGDKPALASAFFSAFQSGNYGSAREILRRSRLSLGSIHIGGPLNEAYHDASRNAKGQVDIKNPRQIVPKEQVESYLVKAIRRLGKTASGWVACAEILGHPHADGWKSPAVHGFGGGTVVIKRSAKAVSYILKNLRPLADDKRFLSPGQARGIRTRAGMFMLGAVMKRAKRKKKVA